MLSRPTLALLVLSTAVLLLAYDVHAKDGKKDESTKQSGLGSSSHEHHHRKKDKTKGAIGDAPALNFDSEWYKKAGMGKPAQSSAR
jgi:hypothetical protein